MNKLHETVMLEASLPKAHNGKKKAKLKRQIEIVNYCLNEDVNLAQYLASIGWSYDDLQYENNLIPDTTKQRYYRLSDFKKKKNKIPVVSFFSGAGGLDLGFEAAGFSHLALVEKNEIFCNTLRSNRPKWNVYGPPKFSGDVSNFDEMVGLLAKDVPEVGFDGVFVGGPPCQPFSIAANQRFSKSGDGFKRIGFAHKTNGNLLFEYIALIKHFKPRVFLIENVPGLVEVDGGEQLQRAYAELEAEGYTVNEPAVLMASEHCVPQQRIRLFIVGNRVGKQYQPPQATNQPLFCGAVFNLSLDGVENHITRCHNAESVLRYMKLDYGCRDQLGRVDRLNPLLPSKTVIAGGTAGGGRSHLHPYIPRTISVRESARLQTFPDDYIFTGPVARQFTQVGNAVPPILGAQLATSIFNSFYR